MNNDYSSLTEKEYYILNILRKENISKEKWLEFKQSKSEISEKEILSKIRERDNARKNKDYKLSDQIRDELFNKGVLIEDKDGKTTWKLK